MIVLFCFMLPLCLLLSLPLAYLEMGGRWKGLLPVTLCAFLFAYGWFAFFAQRGGLGFVGESFEWPLVWTGGAVENARGERFVPVVASARIQVYDSKDEFLRGWFIDACGGIFKLHVTEDDNLEVFTSRGNRRLVFAADGTLLGDRQYREDYDRLPTDPTCRVDRVSPWYLWPLAHPILALLPGFAGLLGTGVLLNSDRLRSIRWLGTVSRRPATMVPSDDFGQLSIVVDMMDAPPRGVIDSDYLQNPPSGAWFKQGAERFSLGASTRASFAFAYVPFACVFSVATLGWIYGTQIASGEFHLGRSILGIPLVLCCAVFWTIALMAVCGKVVVTVSEHRGTVFVGIGPLGWTRSFDWSNVRTIRQEGACSHYLGADNGGILLQGTTRLQFGTNLTDNRRCFVLNALKYLKVVDAGSYA